MVHSSHSSFGASGTAGAEKRGDRRPERSGALLQPAETYSKSLNRECHGVITTPSPRGWRLLACTATVVKPRPRRLLAAGRCALRSDGGREPSRLEGPAAHAPRAGLRGAAACWTPASKQAPAFRGPLDPQVGGGMPW